MYYYIVRSSQSKKVRCYTSLERANAVARAMLHNFLEENPDGDGRIEREGKDKHGCFFGEAIDDTDCYKEHEIYTETIEVKRIAVVGDDEEDSAPEEYSDGEGKEKRLRKRKESGNADKETGGEIQEIREEETRESKKRRTWMEIIS